MSKLLAALGKRPQASEGTLVSSLFLTADSS